MTRADRELRRRRRAADRRDQEEDLKGKAAEAAAFNKLLPGLDRAVHDFLADMAEAGFPGMIAIKPQGMGFWEDLFLQIFGRQVAGWPIYAVPSTSDQSSGSTVLLLSDGRWASGIGSPNNANVYPATIMHIERFGSAAELQRMIDALRTVRARYTGEST